MGENVKGFKVQCIKGKVAFIQLHVYQLEILNSKWNQEAMHLLSLDAQWISVACPTVRDTKRKC